MLEYTPSEVSDELLSGAKLKSPERIVDFCAGQGSLLKAAQRVWPTADLFAVDIDPEAMTSVPSASCFRADFLDHSFDQLLGAKLPSKFDLILLNPPFSSDRSRLRSARGSYSDQRCSVAFAFLFTALEYLGRDGELLAIMPTSSLQSDRDATSRQRLRDGYNCKIISPPKYDRFPGLDVSTYFLRITRKNVARKQVYCPASPKQNLGECDAMRGRISVKRKERTIQKGLHGWIHTTSISSSRITERYKLPEGILARDQTFLPRGSLVIPRVGKIRPDSIAITTRREILSDCLFGITLRDPSISRHLLDFIRSDFSNFLNIYSGTGAPYTTRSRITEYAERAISQLGDLKQKGPSAI